MKKLNILLVSVILIHDPRSTFAQSKTISLYYENIKCIYTITNKRLTGNYSSFYENGVKRSEGFLKNGYRYGTWSVWDSGGKKRIERFYKTPLEFRKVFPPIPNEGPIPLLAANQYPLQHDSNNLIKYTKTDVSDAIWRHKIWRNLKADLNEILFKDKRLLLLFYDLIKQQKIQVYSTIDDRFSTIKKMDTFDIKNAEFTGLELKEEVFFDMNRSIFEYRILGLCPIVKYNDFEGSFFWVYFPDIRRYLGQQGVSSDNPLIKTLDDLFFYRDFGSVITKTTINNPMDLPINKYQNFTTEDVLYQAEIEELNIIEGENDLWLKFLK